jgi:hypothetical protein
VQKPKEYQLSVKRFKCEFDIEGERIFDVGSFYYSMFFESVLIIPMLCGAEHLIFAGSNVASQKKNEN